MCQSVLWMSGLLSAYGIRVVAITMELIKWDDHKMTLSRKNTYFVSVAVLLSSCTTLQEISPQNLTANASGLKVGDCISVETKQAERIDLEVVQIQTDRIVGEKEQVMFDDIAKLERKQYSAQKTTALSGLLIGIAVSPPAGLAVALLSLVL